MPSPFKQLMRNKKQIIVWAMILVFVGSVVPATWIFFIGQAP